MFKSKIVKDISIKTLEACNKKVNVDDVATRDSRHLQYLLYKLSKYPRIRGMISTRSTSISAYDWRLVSGNNTDMSEVTERLRSYIDLIISHSKEKLFGSFLFKISKLDSSTQIGDHSNIKIERVPHTSYEKVDDNSFYIWDNENEPDTKRLVDMNDEANKSLFLYLIDGDGDDIGGLLNANAESIIYLINLLPKWDKLNKKMQGIILGTTDGRLLSQNASALSYTAEQAQKLKADYDAVMANLGSDDSDNVLSTLAGIQVNLASLVDGGAANSYSLYKSELQSDIAISILGQANTMELPKGGGSRAALKELNLVRQDIMFSDINDLTRLINRFLEVEHLLSTNNAEIDYKFEFILDDIIDTESNARTLQAITTLGIPIQIAESEVYAKLGLRKPTINETVVTLGNNSGIQNFQQPATENPAVESGQIKAEA